MAGTSPAMTGIAVDIAHRSSLNVVGVDLIADLSGALFWEEERLLVVSDLHLEKGSSFASRGVLLPPYDTVATLGRLASVIARHDPRTVIALGDSFHDRDAHHRLSAPDRDAISGLQARRDWIWISGNHDPALPSDLGGVVASEVAIGKIVFRHEPTGSCRRNRRPSSSQGARGDAGAVDGAALFRQRRRASRHAGVRRLYRRPQHPRCGICKDFPDAGLHGACAWRPQAARDRRLALLLIAAPLFSL